MHCLQTSPGPGLTVIPNSGRAGDGLREELPTIGPTHLRWSPQSLAQQGSLRCLKAVVWFDFDVSSLGLVLSVRQRSGTMAQPSEQSRKDSPLGCGRAAPASGGFATHTHPW